MFCFFFRRVQHWYTGLDKLGLSDDQKSQLQATVKEKFEVYSLILSMDNAIMLILHYDIYYMLLAVLLPRYTHV